MRWIEAGLGLVLAAAMPGAAKQSGSAEHQPAQQPAQQPVQTSAAPSPQPFTVVLDAAHGGSDNGARLRDGVLEKNITLKLAEQLNTLLSGQGIAVTMTRDSDVDVPELNRAEIANHAQAAACLVIHATATGSGVHLFTSSIAREDASPAGTPLPWSTAQAVYVTQSTKLESELDAALTHAEIPVTMGRAAVAPMDHLACPAVAVELAPLQAVHGSSAEAITDEKYQKTVEDAVARAIGSWRRDRMEP